MYSPDDRDDLLAALSTNATGEVSPMAYVKQVVTEKGTAYGVFSGDGTQLALFSTREGAYFAAKQHDLEPVLLH